MPRTKPSYPPEFKAEAVRLVGSGDRSLTRIAKDLGVADQTLSQLGAARRKRRRWS